MACSRDVGVPTDEEGRIPCDSEPERDDISTGAPRARAGGNLGSRSRRSRQACFQLRAGLLPNHAHGDHDYDDALGDF